MTTRAARRRGEGDEVVYMLNNKWKDGVTYASAEGAALALARKMRAEEKGE